MSKYGVFSGPYFPVFRTNTGKYGPEKNPYLDTFHSMFAKFSVHTKWTIATIKICINLIQNGLYWLLTDWGLDNIIATPPS